jgi:hypothetical protein
MDSHYVDADPDSTYHPDADPDADPDYDFLFDADPVHPNVDPDPDPDPNPSIKKAQTLEKVLNRLIFLYILA